MIVLRSFHPFVMRNITKSETGNYVDLFNKICVEGCRQLSSTAQTDLDLRPKEGKVYAWQIHSYGGLEELQLSYARQPIITSPDDVIVNIASCSVNPIDVALMKGYGATLLYKMRAGLCKPAENGIEFPLTLGRDFAGEITAVGHGVTNMKPGDKVWGVVPPHAQGCHAQQTLVKQNNVRLKPNSLSMEEAASILYAGVTAWSALRITGDTFLGGARGKRILILGASGGVGSIAVQMAKAWGAEVIGTCRTDAVHFVEALGAHAVIDYAQPDFESRLRSQGQFDIILDAAGLGANAGQYASLLKQWSNAKYITLKGPLLKNMDDHGLALGALRSAADLLQPNITSGALARGASLRWGYFVPCEAALDEIQLLVEAGKILPYVQKVYSFQEMPAAFSNVQDGHLRGKIVVSTKT